MTEETIKRASELYKAKSSVSKAIGELISSNLRISTMPMEYTYRLMGLSGYPLGGLEESDLEEIKKYIRDILTEKLSRIDKEITELNC